jgi:hypothetical protein
VVFKEANVAGAWGFQKGFFDEAKEAWVEAGADIYL